MARLARSNGLARAVKDRRAAGGAVCARVRSAALQPAGFNGTAAAALQCNTGGHCTAGETDSLLSVAAVVAQEGRQQVTLISSDRNTVIWC